MISAVYEKKFPSNLLEGKVILISGAGSGIGRQIAKSFSEYGAELILLSKSIDKLETLYDEINQVQVNNLTIHPLDFETADEEDYEDIFNAIRDEHPKIDGLINNAGILGEKKPLEQFNYDLSLIHISEPTRPY